MTKPFLRRWQLALLCFLIVGTVVTLRNRNHVTYHKSEQLVFGTSYRITYAYHSDLSDEIHAELLKVDQSLSPFNPTSTISRVNRNESMVVDSMLNYMLELSHTISVETDGAFDITVAPLVNAWGFGFQHKEQISGHLIDSINTFVGYEKIHLLEGRVVKDDPRIMLNCSAIAKGFGCDVVARFFDGLGIENYMVEIGGEIVVKGVNPKGDIWRIGINTPVEEEISATADLFCTLQVSDIAMATSGNYRNFYYNEGKKYAHTIDPQSGYPVAHSLLSVTVLAEKCAMADAYATAFMVMGLEKAISVIERHPDLRVYFIYSDNDGNYETYISPSLESFVKRKKN